MAVTMQDVARRAAVSAKTVSRVVNDHPHISPDKRARVLAAIEELGYQLNPAARTLRTGRSGVIGLGLPDLREPYYAELAHAVLDHAGRRGLTVLVDPTGGDRDRELALLRGRGGGLDGVLLYALGVGADEAAGAALPAVLLGERVAPGASAAVDVDPAVAAAVAHLVETGHRRIAVLGADPRAGSPGARRTEAFRRAAEAEGLTVDEALLVDVGPRWGRHEGAAAAARLLDAGLPFDAVLAHNDALALGALRTALDRGLRVPEDVALIGSGDTEDARYAVPSLTSIAQGTSEVAGTAVALLADRIEGRPPRDDERRAAAVDLRLRESTLGVGVA
ncbi:LacI family DNA-binding transcriptional regulator [Cellulomonas endometrii]|uniref:LacI family DNA-binding transcriptional regulator n=1 Tax=Cellulomonas endometrii TaxID=3036301 RepID=UPI0024AD5E5F|nr:LacI family DNA-binding transcriptional regulator [Cellulomonas endometrii]